MHADALGSRSQLHVCYVDACLPHVCLTFDALIVRFSPSAMASMQSLYVDYAQSSKNMVTVDVSSLDLSKQDGLLQAHMFGNVVTDAGAKGGNLLATQIMH